MTEMDQSRFTTEEQAFLQALDDQAREFQENATAFARQLGEDFAECLRIIRRLAGDRPPADSIRVGTCECGHHRLLSLGGGRCARCGSRSETERVYVPAGDKPDPEAMVMTAAFAIAARRGETHRGWAVFADDARAVVDALYPPKP
jgi:hypothetical protein